MNTREIETNGMKIKLFTTPTKTLEKWIVPFKPREIKLPIEAFFRKIKLNSASNIIRRLNGTRDPYINYIITKTKYFKLENVKVIGWGKHSVIIHGTTALHLMQYEITWVIYRGPTDRLQEAVDAFQK